MSGTDFGPHGLKKRRVKHGGSNFIGSFPSMKKRRMVAYESLLELDLIYLLDFDREVVDFEEQPLMIPFTSSGEPRTFTPDFLVSTRQGYRLVEVKPIQYLNAPRNQIRFEAATRFCNTRGWAFMLLSEKEIRSGYRLANIKLLTMFNRYPPSGPLRTEIERALRADISSVTIGGLVASLEDFRRGDVITELYRMAFHHEVTIPLDSSPLTLASPVYLPTSEPSWAMGPMADWLGGEA
jgi:hypothetical protein